MLSFKLKPAVILAMGECLAISAAVDYDNIGVPGVVEDAVKKLYLGEDPGRLGVEDTILAYTIAYGGLILSYTCDPVTPISRAHVTIGLELTQGGELKGRLDDRDILRSWALIYSGKELEGLDIVKGTTYYPVNLTWKPGGKVKILPVAILPEKPPPTTLNIR